MARNNYRRLAGSRLQEYAGWTGRTIYDGNWPPNEGDLTLFDESGVKRLREYVRGSSGIASGMHDIGPGCLTWNELYLFLDGMCEAERLRGQE